MLIANNNQSAKAEAATALDDFGGTVDENDLLGEFGRWLTVGAQNFGLAAGPASATAAAPRATRSGSGTTGTLWTLYKISHDNSPVSFKILVPLHGQHRPGP